MKTKPNIILINCDDLGYGDLGCYGSTVNSTPAIDQLAKEGIKFTDFYMSSACCTPSRAGMLTGCYAQRISFFHGENELNSQVLFPGDAEGLHQDEITMATLLKKQGYATSMVGKWHVGDQKEFLPTRHGFDSYYGLPYSNDMGYGCGYKMLNEEATRLCRFGGVDDPPLPLIRDEEVIQEQPDQAGITERYTEECVKFMRKNKDNPFFLYFAHMYVHLPLYVPDRFMKESKNGAYGAAVAAIDWSVAVIMDELKKLGIDDNTMVIFTSDNGGVPKEFNCGASNEPLKGAKGTTYEGGIRVPCIVRMPTVVPEGVESSELVTAMDFLPTFAHLAGTTAPKDRIIDGHDITDMLTNPKETKSPYDAFYYYISDDLTAVRSGKWKLWFKENELYDLENDIAETNNIYSQHPEVIEKLNKLGDKIRADIGDCNTNQKGANRRPIGRVANPKPLTILDHDHPYMIAMYD